MDVRQSAVTIGKKVNFHSQRSAPRYAVAQVSFFREQVKNNEQQWSLKRVNSVSIMIQTTMFCRQMQSELISIDVVKVPRMICR